MTALDYQIDFNGTVLGDGTPWEVMSWAGLEEFTTRGSDIVLPTAWGAFPGSSYVDPKVVVITVESINPIDMLLLESALLPPQNSTPDTLVPIRWKFPNRDELMVYGRCSRRSRARDQASTLGLTRVTFEMEIPDPRCYSASLTQLSTSIATSSGGLTFAAPAPFVFGTGGVGGTVDAANAGTIETPYVIVFTGPLVAPTLEHTAQAKILSFTGTLAAGETLVVDSSARTVMLNGTASRYSWLTIASQWFTLQPGSNGLKFSGASGAGTMQISYRNAWL
jgi:tail protein